MKKIHKSILMVSILLIFSNVSAQTINISGYITDKETGEILSNVAVRSGNNFEVSNRFGYFNISTNINNEINFSLQNYSVFSLKLNDSIKTKIYHIKLTPILDEEINTLLDSAKNPILNNTDVGVATFLGSQMKKQPSIFGESDIIKTLQSMPGVKPGNETGSKLIVRGGSFDQNMIMIDGIPMYQRGHFFGLFSTLHPDVFKTVKLYKDGFPAHLGGRLSSVLDLEMKEGHKDGTHGSITTSLFSGRLQLDGPLNPEGKTTYNLGVRRSLLDLVPLNDGGASLDLPSFFDINLKLSHKVNEKDKLFASLVSARDKMEFSGSEPDSLNNGILYNTYKRRFISSNTGVNFKWNHIVNTKKFNSYSVSFVNYISKFITEDSIRFVPDTAGVLARKLKIDNKYRTGVLDIIFKGDYFNNKSAKQNLNYGWEVNLHTMAMGGNHLEQVENGNNLDTIIGDYKRKLFPEITLYGENKIRLKNKNFLQMGLRFSTFINGKSIFFMPEPRLVYVNPINKNSTFKMSYSLMHQPLNMVKNFVGFLIPVDNWYPADNNFKPQRAHHLGLSYDKTLIKGYEFTTQAYFKHFDRVLEKQEGLNIFSLFRNNSIIDVMETGTGNATGLELMLKRTKGRFKGWVSYSLSYSDRKFENINAGKTYPYKFDRRQMLSLVGSYRFNDFYEISFNCDVANGNRATLPIAKYFDINGNLVYDYGSRNWYKIPTYFRLDLNLTKYTVEFTEEINRYWQFGIRNITNHFNPSTIYFTNDVHPTTGKAHPRYEGLSVLGNFMPYITYTLTF